MKRLCCALLSIFVLAGCHPSDPPPAAVTATAVDAAAITADPALLPTATPIKPTAAVTASATAAATATPSQTQAATAAPTRTRPPAATAAPSPQPTNAPPVVAAIPDQTCAAGQSMDMVISYSDPDGDTVTIAPTQGDAAVVQVSMNQGTLRVDCLAAGATTITLALSDGSGGTARATFGIEVGPPAPATNEPPVFEPVLDQSCTAGQRIELAVAVSDPNGDTMTLTPLSDWEVARANFQPNTSNLTVECVAAGAAAVTIEADDNHGSTASITFTVVVADADPAAPTPDYVLHDDSGAVLALVNQARAEAGLSPLTLDARLNQAAQRHAIDMAVHDFVDHTGTDGTSAADRISAAGYRWTAAGENLGAGQTSAEAVVIAWMASEGHRANILNPDFTQMGLAHVSRPGTAWVHYWSETFARP